MALIPFCRVAVVVLAVLSLTACGSPEQQAARHLDRGLQHVAAGDDGRAMAEFRNVLRLDPKQADALHQVGLIHERAQRWPQAVQAFRAAARERPGFVEPNLRLGTLALQANDTATAAQAAADVLAHHPDQPDARVLDAAVMLRQGDLQRAWNHASAVLAADPGHEHAAAVMVGVLQQRGRPEEALALIERTLVDQPEAVSLRLLQGILLEQAGDVAGARRVLESLVALQPEELGHRLLLGAFLEAGDDLAGAQTVLRQALAEGVGDARLGEALVALAFRDGGAAAAEAELDRLIAAQPAEPRFRFLRVELLLREDRITEAEAELAELAADSDARAANDARVALARLHLATDQWDEAEALAEAVLADEPDHLGANVVRGLVHLFRDEADEALRSARTALRRDPVSPTALKLLADAHLQRGEADLAVGALSDAVSLDPGDLVAAETLALLLTRRGDLDAALRVWDHVVQRASDPALALQLRAQIRMRQANWSDAEADVQRLLESPETELGGSLLAGDLDLGRGRYAESRVWFARALDAQPEAEGAVLGMVRAYVAEEDTAGALAFLEARTDERPDDAVALVAKGDLLAAEGEPAAAADAFASAIAAAAEWPVPYFRLADLRRGALGDLDGAIAVYRDALIALGDQPVLLHELGRTLAVAGRWAEAIAVYERLVDGWPADDLAANNFAALVADHAHDDPRLLDQALRAAERFRTSTSGDALDTLGWVYFRNGDHAMAVSLLERALGQLGDDPQVRFHLGMALDAAGETERARAELERAIAAATTDAPWLGRARAALAALDG